MLLTRAFHRSPNDETRAFAKFFFEKRKDRPSIYQAGVCLAVVTQGRPSSQD